ncbi:MAG: DUF5657 family protein [Candidatus Hodarchaeales archaeon]|jgi:uncharacterized membrane-anchored protein YhcB (DUF1043 family)
MTDLIFSEWSDTTWLIIKLAFLIGILLYVIFAYIVTKQVKLMNETIEVGLENTIKIISYVHLAVSIFILILSMIIL